MSIPFFDPNSPLQVSYLTAVLAFSFCLISLFIFRPISERIGLVDHPDANRKQHNGVIPLIGGICVFIGITSTLLLPDVNNPQHFHIYISVLFIMGVWDDYKDLPVRPRVLTQIAVALFVCILENHLITYVGDVIGIGQIGTWLLAIPITVIAIVTAINAFNMMDGIDGLASSIAIVSFASLAVIFYERQLWTPFQVCVGFVAALIPFLLNNLNIFPFKSKVFLGDSGSVIIGFAVVWLLIEGSQPENMDMPEVKAFYPVTAMWIVGLPLFDLVSVCIRRLSRGQSPVAGDRDHIHHIILQNGFSLRNCLAICILIEIALSLIGLLFDFMKAETFSFAVFWLSLIVYHFALTHLSKTDELKTA